MCVLAIQYKTTRDAHILVAHNREEYYDRPSQGPRIQSGRPRVICGIDRKAGGTWLGVNQYGVFVAVANRAKTLMPPEPRSRGLLCRELLAFRTAREAAEHAAEELVTEKYAGATFVCADSRSGSVVYGADQVQVLELTRGLHIMTNGTMDDPGDERQQYVRRLLTLQRLDSAVAFLAVASKAFSRHPDEVARRGVVTVGNHFGTVSSTLLALTRKSQHAVLQYAGGPPPDHAYDDLSALLRQVLSSEKAK